MWHCSDSRPGQSLGSNQHSQCRKRRLVYVCYDGNSYPLAPMSTLYLHHVHELQALFIALTIVVSLFAASGGVRHAYYMSESKLLHVTKLGFIAQPIATIAQGLSKISVAFLLLRILGNVILPWRKVLLWLVIIITAILSIIQSFLTFYQCKNPEALWNPIVAKTTSCWNPNVQANFAIFTSSQSCNWISS